MSIIVPAPIDQDQPVPYALTDAGWLAHEPIPYTLPGTRGKSMVFSSLRVESVGNTPNTSSEERHAGGHSRSTSGLPSTDSGLLNPKHHIEDTPMDTNEPGWTTVESP